MVGWPGVERDWERERSSSLLRRRRSADCCCCCCCCCGQGHCPPLSALSLSREVRGLWSEMGPVGGDRGEERREKSGFDSHISASRYCRLSTRRRLRAAHCSRFKLPPRRPAAEPLVLLGPATATPTVTGRGQSPRGGQLQGHGRSVTAANPARADPAAGRGPRRPTCSFRRCSSTSCCPASA